MPFMLQACGHALRYSKPDGVCGRCTMDVDGHDGSSGGSRINAENVMPSEGPQDVKKPFLDQVEKLVAVMVNSEGPEITDAVTHVARTMSTFTAAERGDFIYELVIKFCEARREDQPKIDILFKELGKKNVLAKTHFLQSTKRLVSESASLAVDLPNIYDCTVQLIGTTLSHLKNPTENLEAFAKILHAAPEAGKFLLQLRRHFPTVLIPSTPGKDGSSSATPSGQPRPTIGFFLSPTAAKDKFIRPVGMRSPSPPRKAPRHAYSRGEMLKIEATWRSFPLPEGLLERVKVVKDETWQGPGDNLLKRPRFVSESGTGGEGGGTSTKRMLESTSPPLVQVGSPGLRTSAASAAEPRRLDHLLATSPSASGGASLTGFDRPRYVPSSDHGGDKSPKKPYHDQGSIHLHHHHPQQQQQEGGTKPRFSGSASAAGQPKTEYSPRQTAGGSGDKAAVPSGGATSRLGSGKTKKFLTALNVERITETDSSQLSPTLSPNVKTWSRGSGSLNTFSLRPGLSAATSPSALKETGKAASPTIIIPPRTLGMNQHSNNGSRGSPGSGQIGDPPRSLLLRGGQAKSDHQQQQQQQSPDQNWRRGLSQA